ncbi:MAG: regulatory protein MarR [Bacteroidetes bacterium]|nr:regulatory protein MarR [Bacteroidota bacterium]
MDLRNDTILREPLGRIAGKISRVFFGALQKRLSHLDIERSFYPLLLIDAGKGELTQQDLASKLFSDKVQVVRIVDYLSANGYVERIQNPKDRRQYKLHVTDKGHAAVPEIKAVVKELSQIAFKGLSPEKIDELYSTLDLIETNLVCLKTELEE